MRAHINEDSLIRANAQFWEQMLGMQLAPVPFHEDFYVDAGHVLVSVGISGMWNGRIEVRIAMDLARMATAAMLMQAADTVGEADTLDATREIANMIAGLLKSSLPQPCSMTVPWSEIATEGIATEGLRSQSRADQALTVAFRHASGGLLVQVRKEESMHIPAVNADHPELLPLTD